jgi:TolB protein
MLGLAMAAEPRLVAFERAGEIWVANLDGTGAKKIARGVQPNISPDSKYVAFNTESEKSLDRNIAFVDIATKKITIFKREIPSQNCQHAVWSPDSSQILFNLFTEEEWHLGLISADGSGFRYVKKAPTGKSISFWSACWAPDGKSIYVQDLDKISQLSPDGAVLKVLDLHKLFPTAGMTSSSSMAVSPDGNSLLLGMEVTDEEVNRQDWDGPPPSIWVLDLTTEKATRLTPKGFFGWSGVWLSNDEILFISQGPKEKQPSLYRMSRVGENRKQVLKNADWPTVSR